MRWLGLLAVAACRFGFESSVGDGGTRGDARDALGDGGAAGDGRVKVATGNDHTCLIRGNALYCFGSNVAGQLGVNDTTNRDLPALVPGDWIEVAAGTDHSCAVDTSGSLYCWGGNAHGELGVGDTAMRLVPTKVPIATPVRYVDATWFHTCVVLDNGSLVAFGENSEGQLGQGDAPNSADIPSPVAMSAQSNWTSVGCGYAHTIGIQGDGSISGTGRNTAYQLGLGDTASMQYRLLTPIDQGPWSVVTGGQDFSFGIRGGDLYGWSNNQLMQLGTGDATAHSTPFLIDGVQTWIDVEIDTFHGCALAEPNEMYCWGRNVEGQLGLGDGTDRFVPTRTGSNWKAISVGRFHSCGEREDGTFWCAGKGGSGNLGIGPAGNTRNWTQVMLPPS